MSLQKIQLNLRVRDYPLYIKGILYSIYNIVENKYYIGQTRTHRRKKETFVLFGADGRWKEHQEEAQNPELQCQSRLLNDSIRQYNKSDFIVSVICECSIEELNELEAYYILEYNSLSPNGYNLTSGGRTGSYVAPEVRQRLSDSGLKYFSKEGTKEKQSSLISKFFYDDIIKRYSSKEIDRIEIRPIKEDGSFSIIYIYVYSTVFERIRIGGKHISFNDALEKSKKISTELLKGNPDKLKISPLITNAGNEWARYLEKAESLRDRNISKVRFTIHKHTKNDVISTFIKTQEMTSWKDEIKIVFGGKTISLEDGLRSAIAFYSLIEYDIENIVIENEKLKVLWRDYQIAGNS